MNKEAFLKNFLINVVTQNAMELRTFFHDQAIIRWHNTDEEFTVEEYIRANCEYPGQWNGQVERAEFLEDKIIYVARIWGVDSEISLHVTSFLKLSEDKIIQMDEYFSDDGEKPLWRLQMNIGKPIDGQAIVRRTL